MLDRLKEMKLDDADTDTANPPTEHSKLLELELQGVVHDLRNHINGIVLALCAATRVAVDTPVKKQLFSALRSARQGSRYLEDMLALARPDSPPASDFIELNQLFAEMRPMIGHTLGESIRLSLETSERPLRRSLGTPD